MASCHREMVSLSYSQAQLRALWSVAAHEDIMAAGVWDARVATLHRWSEAHKPWVGEAPPIMLASFYFSWGNAPRLWAVEYPIKTPPTLPWVWLGDLEKSALGATLHGTDRAKVPT